MINRGIVNTHIFNTQVRSVATNASDTPACTLIVDGVEDSTIVTVSLLSVGEYTASFTAPTDWHENAKVHMRIVVTIDGEQIKLTENLGNVLPWSHSYLDGFVTLDSDRGESGTQLGRNGTFDNPCNDFVEALNLVRQLGTGRMTLDTHASGNTSIISFALLNELYIKREVNSVLNTGGNTLAVLILSGSVLLNTTIDGAIHLDFRSAVSTNFTSLYCRNNAVVESLVNTLGSGELFLEDAEYRGDFSGRRLSAKNTVFIDANFMVQDINVGNFNQSLLLENCNFQNGIRFISTSRLARSSILNCNGNIEIDGSNNQDLSARHDSLQINGGSGILVFSEGAVVSNLTITGRSSHDLTIVSPSNLTNVRIESTVNMYPDGNVFLDIESSDNGDFIDYSGTREKPVNDMTKALTVSAGIRNIRIVSGMFSHVGDFSGITIKSHHFTHGLVLGAGASNLSDTTFRKLTLSADDAHTLSVANTTITLDEVQCNSVNTGQWSTAIVNANRTIFDELLVGALFAFKTDFNRLVVFSEAKIYQGMSRTPSSIACAVDGVVIEMADYHGMITIEEPLTPSSDSTILISGGAGQIVLSPVTNNSTYTIQIEGRNESSILDNSGGGATVIFKDTRGVFESPIIITK